MNGPNVSHMAIVCHEHLTNVQQEQEKTEHFSPFFFSELGTEPRALSLLGKRSTTELNPQPLKTEHFIEKRSDFIRNSKQKMTTWHHSW